MSDNGSGDLSGNQMKPKRTPTRSIRSRQTNSSGIGDTMKYHTERSAMLQAHYEKLRHRLGAMYEDKLDGKIDQDFLRAKMFRLAVESE